MTDEFEQSDLLGYILQNSNLNVEQIGDLLLGLIFGGHETTTTSIVLSIYYLHQCPKALEQLRVKHVGIIKSKMERGAAAGLTWDDYKKMSFTQCVISESLRLGNIIKLIRKKASPDIHYKGYDIPSGWSVILLLVSAHMDSSVYEDPEKLDPWRWKNSGEYNKSEQWKSIKVVVVEAMSDGLWNGKKYGEKNPYYS
ncbi:cytochrome P450 90B2-like [Phalaenopsis equestris]|uniref:cytochrome P450 90B2-like n=1 Tax=Phalaenopsis equestris TaxID=78828 RepID=UPI0009E1DD6E|nr:cytochrome P450 90B2-like [Phalaenopsis equestris]